jgi:N-acetylneuraminate synthase
MEPQELRQLREDTERASLAIGAVRYGATASETESLQFRRSLYVVRDLRAGEPLDAGAVRAIRPGHGLPPRFLGSVIGRRAGRDLPAGTPLAWELLA